MELLFKICFQFLIQNKQFPPVTLTQVGCVAQWKNVGLWPVNFRCLALDLQVMGDYC